MKLEAKHPGPGNRVLGDYRDGSAIKSSGCYCREPEFEPQPPHGSSQPPMTAVPGDLTLFSGLCRHCTH